MKMPLTLSVSMSGPPYYTLTDATAMVVLDTEQPCVVPESHELHEIVRRCNLYDEMVALLLLLEPELTSGLHDAFCDLMDKCLAQTTIYETPGLSAKYDAQFTEPPKDKP